MGAKKKKAYEIPITYAQHKSKLLLGKNWAAAGPSGEKKT